MTTLFFQAVSAEPSPDDLHACLEQATGLALIGRENDDYDDYVSADHPLDAVLVVRNSLPDDGEGPLFPQASLGHTVVVLEVEDLAADAVERVRRLPGLRYLGEE